MSDEVKYFRKGLERGQEGKNSPLGISFRNPDKNEWDAAQRGWEAGRAAKAQAEETAKVKKR